MKMKEAWVSCILAFFSFFLLLLLLFTIQNTKFEFFIMANKNLFIVHKMNLYWDMNSNLKIAMCTYRDMSGAKILSKPLRYSATTSNGRGLHKSL